jgi:ferrochelatase
VSGRIAVILFNLGGPDGPDGVRPFLFNLFNDPAIIGLPQPLRGAVAQLVSARRAPVAREIYAKIGGASPLLANTQAQARALEAALGGPGADGIGEVRAFPCMRYWHPMSDETATAVHRFAPDRVVLLPLYPHYSTTTTASSLQEWRRAAKQAGLTAPEVAVCCYPTEPGLVTALARGIGRGLDQAIAGGSPRLLFSAHGLPRRVVARGDPYPWQVEQTAKAVAAALARPGLDWRVSYQSRVGPLEWIGPATDEEIRRAGAEHRPLVVAPVAFVSEHSETLVELDIDYRDLAERSGVPGYVRVPAVGVDPDFIGGLARLVRRALVRDERLGSADGGRLCPPACRRCALAA